MLPISTIARVVVNASRTVSVPTSFDTGLMLLKDPDYAAAKRLRTYSSAAEAAAGLIADGFASTTEAYKAMPIQVALTLAGSLESVVINVNVQL